ncbi:MAG: glycosyltransferase [Cetobacterium sp.]
MDYKFSVLMSVYIKERPEYLEKALESVFNQTLKPDEVVLVKDGPLSEELEKAIDRFLNKEATLKIVALSKNMGLGEALRIGVEKCSYDLIARMDTDDICKKNRFEEQIQCFKNNPDLDMVGSWIDEFQEKNGEIIINSIRKTPELQNEIIKKLKRANAFNHPTVMYKKEAVLKAGNYSEEFNCLEDYYLWVRMAVIDCKFYNIQKSLICFRITSETSKRRGGIKMLKSDIKLHDKFEGLKFITKVEKLKNIIIWMIYRIVSPKMRSFLQKKIIRRIK